MNAYVNGCMYEWVHRWMNTWWGEVMVLCDGHKTCLLDACMNDRMHGWMNTWCVCEGKSWCSVSMIHPSAHPTKHSPISKPPTPTPIHAPYNHTTHTQTTSKGYETTTHACPALKHIPHTHTSITHNTHTIHSHIHSHHTHITHPLTLTQLTHT